MVAAGTAVLIGAVAGIGRVVAPAPRQADRHLGRRLGHHDPTTTTAGATGGSTTTTTGVAPKGTAIGAASQVPVGGSAAFNDPKSGDPSLVIQHTAGDFMAFDAICPHAGCTVAYQSSSNIIACPCHGSEFNPRTGAVDQRPGHLRADPDHRHQGVERGPVRRLVARPTDHGGVHYHCPVVAPRRRPPSMTAATAQTPATPGPASSDRVDADRLGVGHPVLRSSIWPRWAPSS